MQDPDDGRARVLPGPPGLTQAAPLYPAAQQQRRSAGMRRRVHRLLQRVRAVCRSPAWPTPSCDRRSIWRVPACRSCLQGKLPKGESAGRRQHAGGPGRTAGAQQPAAARNASSRAWRRTASWRDLPADPVTALQGMLSVTRLEGTNVILIEARGPHRTLLPRLINVLIETYGEQQLQAGRSSSQAELGGRSRGGSRHRREDRGEEARAWRPFACAPTSCPPSATRTRRCRASRAWVPR